MAMILDFRSGELRHTCGGLYTKWFGQGWP
jgi:hypothetical protein